jgi:hypothetical protein
MLQLPSGRMHPQAFDRHDLQLLEDFVEQHSRTVTLGEVAAGDHDPSTVVLRHDVDHCPEQALRFARWEHKRGYRASYFLLPSASYWRDGARTAALALQEMGHEVGVHNDSLVMSRGDVGEALALLRAQVGEMRSWGIRVHGVADHGGVGWQNTDLWRVHMHSPSEVAVDYEAYLLHQMGSHYVSDNQGRWRAERRRVEGRQTHMLIHPEHWQLPGAGRAA